jgi:hypothetical protein
MRRLIILSGITLSLLFGFGLRRAQLSSSAKMRTPAAAAGSQLDPNSFISLGAFPTLAAGQYYINASQDNANPTLLQADKTTVISTGVFYDPTPADTTNRDEIAVFTYNSITIPAGVNISGLWVANSRPVALLAQGNITLNGSVDVSGEDGEGRRPDNQAGAGGAAGPGGGGGGAGGIGDGDDALPPGRGNLGGVGLVVGENSGPSSDPERGGDGGSVSPNGGGSGTEFGHGGGGAFGGNGGKSFGRGHGAGGSAYGDLALQLQGGSGGGGGSSNSELSGGGGGGGGGAVALGSTGTFQLNGQIRANGGGTAGNLYHGGGGAGGGILLYGQTVVFSLSASVSASGGLGNNNSGGGGGRIRIVANTITEGCINVSGGPGMGPEFAGVYTAVGTVVPFPLRLAFDQQPAGTTPNTALNPAVIVRVLDPCGNLATSSSATITLTLNNANGAMLSGHSVAAVGGLATFPNLKVSKAGTGYTLTANSNGLTSTTSDPFNITCPAITATVSGGGTICPTETGFVDVTVSGGTAPYTINLTNGGGTQIGPGPFRFSVMPSSDTIYQLAASTDANGCPISGSGSAAVTVNPVTSIQTSPQPQTKTVGQSAMFSVSAMGLNLSYQWRKNQQPILGAMQSSFSIPAVTFSDQGSYDVVVTGACGMPTSQPAQLTVTCQTLNVTGPTVNTGITGSPFSQSFTQTGGVGTTNFSTASTLPAGLTLGANGLLSGTPTQPGNFPLVVVATDSNNCQGQTNYTLTINCATLALAGLPSATAGSPYAAQLQASPAGGNYQFSSADKPVWLTLTNAGALSGTPPVAGTFSFSVSVTGFGTCTQTIPVTLTVNCPTITLIPAMLPNGAIGAPYAAQPFNVAPAGTSYSLALTGGQLPPGMTFSNGALSGTPTAGGAFSFTVTAAGWGSCTKSQPYTLAVIAICPTITLNPASLPGGNVGTAYVPQTFSASGGDGPHSYAVTGGALPGGLTLNPAGSLSGTPTASGTFSFTVTVTGAGGCSGSRNYTLSIGCASLNWTPASLPNAQAGVAYHQTVTASGAASYGLLTGNLPPGLTLNAATGVLSGMATATGTYNFTLQAIAAGGCSGTRAYSVTVTCPAVAVDPATLPNGTMGTAYQQNLSATPSGNYSFSKTSGSLPPGLSLNAAGGLSGTPATAGTYTFTVTATGLGSCTGSRQYTLTISAACATVTLPALPATGKVGVNYSGNLAATTPSGTYTFTVESGSLPPGLTINNLFGQLSGKPAAAGSYNFTLRATRNNGCTGTREYTVTITSATSALARLADYDGDGKSDLSLWTASNGRWQILRSRDEQATQTVWGGAGDVSLLGDYDGDGQSDLAVFRPGNGTWYILKSGQGGDGDALVKAWGTATDVPVPGDYDGDGKTDVAVWRPAEGNWYVLKSSDGGYFVKAWGLGRAPYLDVPVPGDYDGDGITDLAVFRRSSGTWLIQRSTDNQYTSKAWGAAADVPVVGDYDGDGQADLAVWRGATGEWFVLRSSDGGYDVTAWGAASVGDVPAPGDYDGDGKADWAVWRPSAGQWFVRLSADSRTSVKTQGRAGDIPVAAR